MFKFEMPAHLRKLFGQDAFSEVMRLQGRVYRDVRGRRTLQVELNGQSYFVKQHFGVGWREIFKNLFSFKMPIIGAMTEVHAIQQLAALDIATTPLVAYGVKGNNPATQQSFVLTQDLGDIISLEDLCAGWPSNPPVADFKRTVIIAMAQIATRMHGAGLCHRDFYLCHLVMRQSELAQGKVRLIVIDLHRMLSHQPSGGASVMKDIAGLMFSSMDCGFDAQDWALFKQHYLPQSPEFWARAHARAQSLYAKFHSKKFQQRLAQEKAAID